MRRCLFALFAAVAFLPVFAQTSPPMPYEDPGACPFEGCIYGRTWIARDRLPARTMRDANAAIAFTVQKGDVVEAVTGVVVTTSPGRVVFRQPADLQWWSSVGALPTRRPARSGVLHVVPGDVLFLLTYRGEGNTAVWFKGELYDEVDGVSFLNGVCDFDRSRCAGDVAERPQTIWWVQIRNADGNVGWTNEPDKLDCKSAIDPC